MTTTVGVIMLLLSFGALYVYMKHVRPKELASSSEEGNPELEKRNQLAMKRAAELKAAKSQQLTIDNVGIGGMVNLKNIGLEMLEFDAQVTAKNLYKSGSERWYELVLDRGSDKVYLSIEQDDELELSLTLKALSLDLIGLSKNDLNNLRPNEDFLIQFEGAAYRLDSAGSATFCKNGNELEPEPFQYWEFMGEEGQSISVERWEDGSCDVNFAVQVDPSQLTVYSTS